MKGYWQMPDETAKKLKNGWLHTGDLGRMDEDGYIYIVERKNDMIISGGVNIYPREIEEVLYRHPAVSEASVIGLPDEHWGKVPKAVIVLRKAHRPPRPRSSTSAPRTWPAIRSRRASISGRSYPRGPQGKILKKEIRKKY